MYICIDIVTVHIDILIDTPELTIGHIYLDVWHTHNFNVMNWKTQNWSATNILHIDSSKYVNNVHLKEKNQLYLTVFRGVFNHKRPNDVLWQAAILGSFAYEYYIRWHSVHI